MKSPTENTHTNGRKTLIGLCSTSCFLLSVVCCIALFHVEFRIHEHRRLISQLETFRQEIQREVAQVQQDCKKERVTKSNHPDFWQNTKGGWKRTESGYRCLFAKPWFILSRSLTSKHRRRNQVFQLRIGINYRIQGHILSFKEHRKGYILVARWLVILG